MTPPLWHHPGAPRIWRAPDSAFNGDEIRQSPAIYTDQRLRAIAAADFNGVWLHGRLRQLMHSHHFPTLNDADAEPRRAALRQLIARARQHGIGIWLYFNEPLALAADHPFWQEHPELRGARHTNWGEHAPVDALCTSAPPVQAFLRQAIDELFAGPAQGLAGVILITASENHTNCWSHHARYSLEVGAQETAAPLGCPRCREREPAAVVGELISLWAEAATSCAEPPRVLAWNWSWNMWYPEPQREVIAALPPSVELLVDFERGTHVERRGHRLPIDEYALSVAGPSERFLGSLATARRRGMPIHAKLQLGTTHELATVPNLPLIPILHSKLAALTTHQIAGFMGCWNFGCSLTLNTAAISLFTKDPQRYTDRLTFLDTLARRYFALSESTPIRAAWDGFVEAFHHYPFAMRMLYFSPVNYAVAYPLLPRYEGTALTGSWIIEPRGDRLHDSLPPAMSSQDVGDAFAAAATRWEAALIPYTQALDPPAQGPADHHQRQELSTARMIALQLRSASHIYHFHAWRLDRLQTLDLEPPCHIPLDTTARRILTAEQETCRRALSLVQADTRLGYHQEPQAYQVTPEAIQAKLHTLAKALT